MGSITHIARRAFVAGAGALAFAALPGTRELAAVPKRGGTLRVSINQAVTKLDPLQTRLNPEYLVAELLYSGLTRLAVNMAAEPDLAHAWSYTPDLTEWTFLLRDGLVFHDGSPCTAADVVASFAALLDPAAASPALQNIGPIARVTARDRTTVVFTLSAPFADLPVALTHNNAKIVPTAAAKAGLQRLARTAIGTGPFKLVSCEPERLVVERNDAFYDRGRPYLDRVEILLYRDAAAESAALVAGDIDLMATVAPTDYARLKAAPGVNALRLPSGQFFDLVLGCRQKPFDDRRVRKALALTLDRPALVELAASGYGTPGNDTPLNSAYRFHADLPVEKPDLAQARRLLAEAGHPNGLGLTLTASDSPDTRAKLAEAVRDMAKPAGFAIAVKTVPHDLYMETVWRKDPFYVGFYNMQPTADAIFSLLYTSNAAWNETHWDNAAFDRLVGEARTTIDEAKRRQLYADAQQLMQDEAPVIIPVFFDLLGAQREYVQGYRLHPRGAVFRLDHVALGTGAPARS